jgi:1-acyl-sn-glycerol-3-phosphate acyltransferase
MNPVYWLGHCLFREVSRGFFGLTVVGAENLKLAGPALIASNHVSYLDPPFIGSAFDEDIYFLARKSLFRHRFGHWLLTRWQAIPVDRDRPDPGSIKMIFRRLKEGKKVIIFPEGTRSQDGNLLPGEPGVGMMIAKAQVPVLPVRIFGAFEALPRDKKLPRPARITVSVGKPWHYRPEDFPNAGKDLYQQISDEVMRRIAELQQS